MKSLGLIFFFVITLQFSHAKDFAKEDFEVLMKKYLNALQQKDEKALANISSDQFFKKFKKNGLLKRVFKAQKNDEVGNFDLVFKKAVVDKSLYMVNIKDPGEKSYTESWYFVKEKDGSLYIDDMYTLK